MDLPVEKSELSRDLLAGEVWLVEDYLTWEAGHPRNLLPEEELSKDLLREKACPSRDLLAGEAGHPMYLLLLEAGLLREFYPMYLQLEMEFLVKETGLMAWVGEELVE